MSSIVHGIDRKLFVSKESAFDTPYKFASADAYRGPDLELTPEFEDVEIEEALGSGSTQFFVRGKESGKFTSACAVEPSGTVDTPPDIDPFLEATFGTKTVNAGTSVVYTCNDLAKPSLALCKHAGDELQVGLGAWVEQLEINVPGGSEPPMFNFSGGYARHGAARGGVTLSAGASSGQPIVTVSAANAAMFRAGGMVNFTGHAGYLISSVNYTTGAITLASNLTGALNSGDPIFAWSPSITTAGEALGPRGHGLTIGGTSYGFISSKVTFATGTHAADREASATRPTGSIRGKRTVNFEIEAYLTPGVIGPVHAKAYQQGTSAVVLRLGPDTAGKRMKVSMPKAYWKVTAVSLPRSEVATVTLMGTALQNSTAGDEISLTQD